MKRAISREVLERRLANQERMLRYYHKSWHIRKILSITLLLIILLVLAGCEFHRTVTPSQWEYAESLCHRNDGVRKLLIASQIVANHNTVQTLGTVVCNDNAQFKFIHEEERR